MTWRPGVVFRAQQPPSADPDRSGTRDRRLSSHHRQIIRRPALAQRVPIAQEAPYLVRTGERIMIPAGALRDKLTIEAVGEKKIRRTLSLPAAVEADPARLVKILPPLAGRITSLKVQLGGRVEAGQELAVLDSPTWRPPMPT
jgi:multidrug efflux pump subunit AcrA (membrane-fusion protein)